MTEIPRNTRETVEEDYKYFLFDTYYERVFLGELTLEQAMIEFTIETAWTDHNGNNIMY